MKTSVTAPLFALVHFRSVYANRLYPPLGTLASGLLTTVPLKAAVSSTFGCGPEGIAFKEESSLAIWGAVGEAFSHVVLDHGTDVFIWLGAELAAQEGKSAAALAACRTLSEELTEMRFLAPRILAFKEGSSSIFSFSVDTSTQRSSLWTGGKISAAPNFDHETENKAEKKLSSLWRS